MYDTFIELLSFAFLSSRVPSLSKSTYHSETHEVCPDYSIRIFFHVIIIRIIINDSNHYQFIFGLIFFSFDQILLSFQ
jgi:hypothetical protein